MYNFILQSFLCEISPSDRELFFNLVNGEKSTTNNLREKVIEMMDVDYDTPEDTAKKYRVRKRRIQILLILLITDSSSITR